VHSKAEVNLIYFTETTKRGKKKEKQKVKTDKLRSIGKQSGESVVSPGEKGGNGEKDLHKTNVLSLE